MWPYLRALLMYIMVASIRRQWVSEKRIRAGKEEQEQEVLAAPSTMRPIGREGKSRKADAWRMIMKRERGKGELELDLN